MNTLLAQTEESLSVFELGAKGGIMMIPILICSLIVVAVVAERLTVLKLPKVAPKGFPKRLGKAMNAGGVQDARTLCKKENTAAGRVVLAGLDKFGHSDEVIEKHMAAAGEHEVYLLRRRLRMLTVIAAVAPLMGLTGTIFGMIRAFQTVAASGESLGKAELLAGGIYEAMVTTAAGLIVAMPTLIFYHWLAGKVEHLARALNAVAVGFIEDHVLEKKAGQVAGTTSADSSEVISPPQDDPVSNASVVVA